MIETMEIKPDADEIILASGVLLDQLKQSEVGGQVCVLLFEELVGATRDYLNDGIAVEKAQYTALEWAQRVDRSTESSKASEYVRRHLKKFRDHVDSHTIELDQALKQSGCRYRVKIFNTPSKGHHQTYYYLGLESFELDPDQTNAALGPNVRYRVSHFEKPLPWAKPLLSIDLEGMRLVYLAAILVSGVAAAAGLISMLVTGKPVLVIALLTLCTLPIASLAWALWKVVDDGIARAPVWLYGFNILSAFFEWRPTDRQRANGTFIKQIRLVAYKGECSVCNAALEIVPGKREFRGRLVGKCNRSGLEHLFSFDHVSKTGVPLRDNAYYR
jgi:hypothetical protein